MTVIGVYDAKTHLPQLLERVSRGERFVITKHGRPIAHLIPPEAAAAISVIEVIKQMQDWQESEGPVLGADLTISDLRNEGRRF